MVTVFEPNRISIWFKICHHDHIPFTAKGNGNIVFSMYVQFMMKLSKTNINIYACGVAYNFED